MDAGNVNFEYHLLNPTFTFLHLTSKYNFLRFLEWQPCHSVEMVFCLIISIFLGSSYRSLFFYWDHLIRHLRDGGSASWIRGSDPAINLRQETMMRYLCNFISCIVLVDVVLVGVDCTFVRNRGTRNYRKKGHSLLLNTIRISLV